DSFTVWCTHHGVVFVKEFMSQKVPEAERPSDGFLIAAGEVASGASNPIQHFTWLPSHHLMIGPIETLFLQFAASYAEKIQNLDHFAFKNLGTTHRPGVDCHHVTPSSGHSAERIGGFFVHLV